VNYTYQNRLRTGTGLQTPGGAAWTQSYGYDLARRLRGITSPAGSFGYVYDPVEAQRVDKLTLPNGAQITNSYDTVARLTGTWLINSSGADLDSYVYGYNRASQRTNVVRTAGDYVNYTYDNLGELKTATGQEKGGVTNRWQEQLGYVYDPAGNLNYRTNNALLQRFNVNNLNELAAQTNGGPLTVAGSTTSRATNVMVNSLRSVLYGDVSFASTNQSWVNGNNTYTAIAKDVYGRNSTGISTVSLAGTNTYSYDLNGNLLTDGTRNFGYDDENELIAVWQVNAWSNNFVYDGKMRRRIERDFTWNTVSSAWQQTNEIHFIYDGNLVIQERDINNQPQVTYTRGIDLSGTLQGAGGIGGLLARTDRAQVIPGLVSTGFGTSSYYHADGNGNVTMLIDGSQMNVAKYLYDPFGNMLAKYGLLADVNNYRFSSKEWNGNSGLYYYLYRFYDPNLQRWVNRDPLDEPGFETLHLVSQPLFIRKLRLNINDSEIQYFLAMAIQSGSIDVSSYLRNSHSSYRGSSIPALAFFNVLRGGEGNYTPNWPVELLEYPNLYQYVANDSLDGVDPYGEHWWNDFWDWLKEVVGEGAPEIHPGTGVAAPFVGALQCGPGMYNLYPKATNEIGFINNDDPYAPVPPTPR
jgi:RHS repeat-associated protein